MSERNFFAEMKRRNVYKVAVAYAVVAWLLIQLASILFPTFEAPAWVMKVFVALVALGFPLALILAWAFELTPEGIKRTEDVASNQSITRRTGRKLMAGVVVIAVVAAGLLAFQMFRTTAGPLAEPKTSASATIPDKSIAVLPFENLSDDKSNAYFADGIQDQILTKLASIADLKVISRISTAKYKSKPEDLKTVSRELGVANVLEGTVQRAGDKVRINVQLIDARADRHLWARNYDRELKDVFAVQSEVSQEIADALRANLSPSEAGVLAAAPTQNSEAYDLFLRGEHELREGEIVSRAEPLDRASAYYQQALERDPNFAVAAARWAQARLVRHWFVEALTPAEMEAVKAMIDKALSLAPNAAESHIALGRYYYHGHRQYDPALKEFQRVLELQPNNVSARQFSAFVYRRQGHWERSLTTLAKSEELDPRDGTIPANAAASFIQLRQWDQGRQAALRSLALDPRNFIATRNVFLSWINGNGDLEQAKRATAAVPPEIRFTAVSVAGPVSSIIEERNYLHVMERDFAAALKIWDDTPADPRERMKQLTARSSIHLLAGDAAAARAEAEQALPLLEARLRDQAEDAVAMTQLSWVYLALDRPADALRIAGQAADLISIERDAFAGPAFTAGLSQIQARAGQPREAIANLRRLLSIPAGIFVSLKRLALDPGWDPIRNDPEFQQLLAGKEQIGPNKKSQ